MEENPNMCGNHPPRDLDLAIARLAGLQHDVVGRRQLLDLGFDARSIEHRLTRCRLHPVLRGVSSVTPNPPRLGRWMAATLAAGPEAVLSHRAAAALLGIRPFDVPEDERTTKHGIPTTGLARTLLDLASILPLNHVQRAARRAETNRITDTLIHGFECDAVWPEHRLIVELDSRRHHTDLTAFEADRARDRTLQTHGWRVVRLTAKQLTAQAAHDLKCLFVQSAFKLSDSHR